MDVSPNGRIAVPAVNPYPAQSASAYDADGSPFGRSPWGGSPGVVPDSDATPSSCKPQQHRFTAVYRARRQSSDGDRQPDGRVLTSPSRPACGSLPETPPAINRTAPARLLAEQLGTQPRGRPQHRYYIRPPYGTRKTLADLDDSPVLVPRRRQESCESSAISTERESQPGSVRL